MSNLWAIIVGALSAIIGGAVADEIRARVDRKRQRDAIKISISDELSEIEAGMKNMLEVWNKSKMLHSSYAGDLSKSTTTYDECKINLHLIDDVTLRKDIVSFYKKLRDLVARSRGKIGTLAQTIDAIAEQTTFSAEFKQLGENATGLISRLKN
jgi:hypothetical protein